MSLTTDDFEEFLNVDAGAPPLGDALAELSVDVDADSVEAVRDVRERR